MTTWKSALPIKERGRKKRKESLASLQTQLKLRSVSAPFKPGKLTSPEQHSEKEAADKTRVFHQLQWPADFRVANWKHTCLQSQWTEGGGWGQAAHSQRRVGKAVPLTLSPFSRTKASGHILFYQGQRHRIAAKCAKREKEKKQLRKCAHFGLFGPWRTFSRCHLKFLQL